MIFKPADVKCEAWSFDHWISVPQLLITAPNIAVASVEARCMINKFYNYNKIKIYYKIILTDFVQSTYLNIWMMQLAENWNIQQANCSTGIPAVWQVSHVLFIIEFFF